jgi:hypothetical protein
VLPPWLVALLPGAAPPLVALLLWWMRPGHLLLHLLRGLHCWQELRRDRCCCCG